MSDPDHRAYAVVVLAAGNSTRMGSPKQLLEFRGKPLLRHATETALQTGCGRVVVVLGANMSRMGPALMGLDVRVALNDRWAEGMGTSIQAGIHALADPEPAGIILTLADQPFVSPQNLRALIAGHQETGKPVVASRYSNTAGVPAFFSREAFPALLALGPDRGCKEIVTGWADRCLQLDCPEAAIDLDTPEDYTRAIAT